MAFQAKRFFWAEGFNIVEAVPLDDGNSIAPNSRCSLRTDQTKRTSSAGVPIDFKIIIKVRVDTIWGWSQESGLGRVLLPPPLLSGCQINGRNKLIDSGRNISGRSGRLFASMLSVVEVLFQLPPVILVAWRH
jgi:hypothetical protein